MLIDLFGIAAAEEPEHEPNDEPDFIAEFDILDPCGWFGGDDDDDGPPASDCVEVKATAMLADAEVSSGATIRASPTRSGAAAPHSATIAAAQPPAHLWRPNSSPPA
jgi:hypothetical protein